MQFLPPLFVFVVDAAPLLCWPMVGLVWFCYYGVFFMDFLFSSLILEIKLNGKSGAGFHLWRVCYISCIGKLEIWGARNSKKVQKTAKKTAANCKKLQKPTKTWKKLQKTARKSRKIKEIAINMRYEAIWSITAGNSFSHLAFQNSYKKPLSFCYFLYQVNCQHLVSYSFVTFI